MQTQHLFNQLMKKVRHSNGAKAKMLFKLELLIIPQALFAFRQLNRLENFTVHLKRLYGIVSTSITIIAKVYIRYIPREIEIG